MQIIQSAARCGSHDVVTGQQSVDPVHAAIISLIAADLRQAFFARAHLVAERRHLSPGRGFACFVLNHPRQHTAFGQRQFEVREFLAVHELDRRARATGFLLSVRDVDVPRLRRAQRVAARRKVRECKRALIVGHGGLGCSQFGARECHARAPHRTRAVAREDAARHRAGTRGLRLRRGVTRLTLTTLTLRLPLLALSLLALASLSLLSLLTLALLAGAPAALLSGLLLGRRCLSGGHYCTGEHERESGGCGARESSHRHDIRPVSRRLYSV